MVAGDLVNTASRVQSIARARARSSSATPTAGRPSRPSSTRRRARTSSKGKEGLSPLWRALRVVSGARGSLKSQGLEAPFVGRDRELRLIKDLFHACADGDEAHLVSITGIAGIGKSRLAWEFFKYFDGIAQITYWHRGRCLSYGEGVTYWALADMVRMRCRIAEDEQPASALEKLQAVLSSTSLDAEERRFVEPRVAHLLGLEDGHALRARRPVRRLAALLRAPDGRVPGDHGLRGHAVGGRLAARLHRLPARVVAEPPALRLHARPPGAARAAADLGRRAAQLHLALPRAAPAAGDGGSS